MAKLIAPKEIESHYNTSQQFNWQERVAIHTQPLIFMCRSITKLTFVQGTLEGNPLLDMVAGIVAEPTAEDIECHAPKPILLGTGRVRNSIFICSIFLLQLYSYNTLEYKVWYKGLSRFGAIFVTTKIETSFQSWTSNQDLIRTLTFPCQDGQLNMPFEALNKRYLITQ